MRGVPGMWFFLWPTLQTPPKRSHRTRYNNNVHIERIYTCIKKKEPTHIPFFRMRLEITCSRENEYYHYYYYYRYFLLARTESITQEQQQWRHKNL